MPTLLGVILLIFAVSQLFTPEQRASLYITNEKQLQQVENIIRIYHLNESVLVQLSDWMTKLFQGNLGFSHTSRMPVLETLFKKLPATIEVVIWCIPIIILLGIYLGIQSAVHKDGPIDHMTRTLAIIGTSLPSFWIGIMLIAIFFSALGWFPPERMSSSTRNFIDFSGQWRWYTGLISIDGLLNGQLWVTLDLLRHVVLPTISLTTINIALIIRVMRSSMLEALGKGYIVAARAKGLSNQEVINKHARRNALIPVVTVSGLLTAGLLTGVTITETVFNIDGVGRWAALAAGGGGSVPDIPGVLGFALFAGIVYVVANLIVDILYAYIDPRIRLG
ncbi:MAG: ABC transporter permease [Candidatus Freyarchaeota archaeon]|nr:ABC transporter permease [Candidatus Jordarchaeia archaeon]